MKSWLMEHFGFVSEAEYEARGRIMAGLANSTRLLQKKAQSLERKVKRQEKLIHGKVAR